MTVSWITPAGNIGTFDERQGIEFTLDALSDVDAVSFTLLAGKLPRGLRLENNKIIGTPTEVRKFT